MRWAAAALLVAVAWPAAAAGGEAVVVDGDTLRLGAERIRLHGIDAPETAQWCRDAQRAWPCGRVAAAVLGALVRGHEVTCDARERDRHGRLIAVCEADGEDLGAWMVAQGWAMAYREYSTDFVALEERARAAGVGMWRGEVVAPWRWRRGARLAAPVAEGARRRWATVRPLRRGTGGRNAGSRATSATATARGFITCPETGTTR